MRNTSFFTFHVLRFTIWLSSKRGYQYLPDALLVPCVIIPYLGKEMADLWTNALGNRKQVRREHKKAVSYP